MRIFFLQKPKIIVYLAVFVLLGVMFASGFFSMRDDTETFDELPHVVAGYSYLIKQDYRLNPEHPPLIKDIAATPLLFLDINFPDNHPFWKNAVNGQWIFGFDFFYHSGNDPSQMIFWSRLPMLLIMIFLGLFIFYWTKKLAGLWPGLLALVLYSFSPNFLAHGRLVTTDVGAALGFVIAIYFYFKFLGNITSRKNIILAGCALGFALLIKFSTFVLIPFFIFISLFHFSLQSKKNEKISLLKYFFSGLIICLIAFLIVGIVYQLHILNYPVDKQVSDSEFILATWYQIDQDKINYEFASNPLIKPYAHYFMGLFRTMARVSSESLVSLIDNYQMYFPILYLYKVPLAFHFLSLISLITLFYFVFKKAIRSRSKDILKWVKNHFQELSMLGFIIMYSFMAVTSPINIGFRHLMPIFPFLYILIAIMIKRWLNKVSFPGFRIKVVILFSLLVWYVLSSILSFPHYLSYYNELAGGVNNGHRISTDSDYDWGKDLKRLVKWVEENEIKFIYMDYFGIADPEYYLKEKYRPWSNSLTREFFRIFDVGWGNSEDFPKGNYLAVSVTFLMHRDLDGNKAYAWLDDYEPVGRAGTSIFIYYID